MAKYMKLETRKTKIVATVGPASENERVFTKMVKAGVNIARLNFSHGDHVTHEARVNVIRSVSKKTKIPVAIIQDLGGPKIRTGDLYKDSVFLRKGSFVTLTTKKCIGDESIQHITYKNLPHDVKKGVSILLDDGKKRLEVVSKTKISIKCKVIVGGEIKARRGVNVPGVSLRINALTEKDKRDVVFGIKHDVEFIALSFVHNANDVRRLKKIIKDARADIGVIAKIETQEALDNIDEIIKEVDGIMIARGDLAVEVPPEDVPILQKKIVGKCNEAGKPVIIATQMMESMISSPVATRAEISDVANSILDGADAVMLSAETAIGEYPVEVIDVMSKVAMKTESELPHNEFLEGNEYDDDVEIVRATDDVISHYLVNIAYEIGAKAIVALTESGLTPRMISRYRPSQPILVMSPRKKTLGKIMLSYGCYPTEIKQFKHTSEAIERIKKVIVKNKYAEKKDKIVIAAGIPFGKSGGTNMIMVRKV